MRRDWKHWSLWATDPPCDETDLLLEASIDHSKLIWTLGASSRILYKLCLPNIDGRHKPTTQGLIGRVHTLPGLGKFCSVFSYLFFYWDEAYRVAPVHSTISPVKLLETWTVELPAASLSSSSTSLNSANLNSKNMKSTSLHLTRLYSTRPYSTNLTRQTFT